jgi:hypothetical protein
MTPVFSVLLCFTVAATGNTNSMEAFWSAHRTWFIAVAILLVEDAIGRSRLAANSTIQLVFGFLEMTPGVGPIVAKLRLGARPRPPKSTDKGSIDALLLLAMTGLGLLGIALAVLGAE